MTRNPDLRRRPARPRLLTEIFDDIERARQQGLREIERQIQDPRPQNVTLH